MGMAHRKSQYITHTKSEGYIQLRRRRLSCLKKGVFYMQEGHVVESRGAKIVYKGLTRSEGVKE